ncbi:MAG: rhomboid family intramembrane serine protease [Actinomycetota bacterium]|nr:rhomboid family intramembrane serine protease [Actinomycetota bacterium]
MLPLKDNIPTRRFPIVTVVIIVINVAMFFGFQQARWDGGGFAVDNQNVMEYSSIAYEITHSDKVCGVQGDIEATTAKVVCGTREQLDAAGTTPDGDQPSTWLTLLTSMFMHGGLLHIGGNMLFLWIFGNNIEDSMGRAKFVAFYLLGGLAATAAQTAVSPNEDVPTLGASGAVAAVLGAYALLYPRARVVTLVFIIIFITVIELPAALVLIGWFVLQVLSASSQIGLETEGGGVAYWAHIGGFVFGLALIKLFANKQRDDYVEPRLPVY